MVERRSDGSTDREPTGLSLRAFLFVGAITTAIMGITVCVCLITLTTLLHRRVTDLRTSLDSVRVTQQIGVGLLLHRQTIDPATRGIEVALLRGGLDDMDRYVQSPKEAEIAREVRANVVHYLALASGPPSAEQANAFANALGANRRLVEINVAQARAAEESARRTDSLANILGFAGAAFLAFWILASLYWMNLFVFRPLVQLHAAVQRFSDGDRNARAVESGTTELRDMAWSFNQMARALGEARLRQLRYLTMVVHDLRNPLTALQLATGYFAPADPLPPDPRIRELFTLMQRQLLIMNSIVGDVLNTAAVEAGELQLRIERCDGRDLLHQSVELFRSMAPQHVIEERAPAEPVWVRCDPVRIAQVLNNLLSNAIKFSRKGSRVRAVIAQPDAAHVSFAVSDEGEGIAPEERERIFEPFQRSAGVYAAAAGVGLGLHISREVVEAHGGRIEVESSPGRGATFTVLLPTG